MSIVFYKKTTTKNIEIGTKY